LVSEKLVSEKLVSENWYPKNWYPKNWYPKNWYPKNWYPKIGIRNSGIRKLVSEKLVSEKLDSIHTIGIHTIDTKNNSDTKELRCTTKKTGITGITGTISVLRSSARPACNPETDGELKNSNFKMESFLEHHFLVASPILHRTGVAADENQFA
jgi:hypothetical protein